MKKLALLLALILLMCLCGCQKDDAESAEKTDAQDQTAITAQTAAENPAAKYVGTWYNDGDTDRTFVRLLPSGNAVIGYGDDSTAYHGRWELDNEQIYVFFNQPIDIDYYSGYISRDNDDRYDALIFQIENENRLVCDRHYFDRVD